MAAVSDEYRTSEELAADKTAGIFFSIQQAYAFLLKNIEAWSPIDIAAKIFEPFVCTGKSSGAHNGWCCV